VLTFHYSSDHRTITLNEIDGELQHGICISPSAAHQKRPESISFQGVFLTLFHNKNTNISKA